MTKIILEILIFLFIFSCTQEKRVVANDPEPAAPPFWYFFTINGIDSDNDGIRDDVEIWINQYSKEYHLNQALKQFARNELKFLNTIDYINARLRLEQDRKNMFCLLFIKTTLHPEEMNKVPGAEILLSKVILNNYWRKRQYNLMGELIPKGTWYSEFKKENERFLSCEFELRHPEELMKRYMTVFKKNEQLVEAIIRIYPKAKNE